MVKYLGPPSLVKVEWHHLPLLIEPNVLLNDDVMHFITNL